MKILFITALFYLATGIKSASSLKNALFGDSTTIRLSPPHQIFWRSEMDEWKKIFDIINDHNWQAAPLTISQQSIDDLFNNRIPYLLVENFLSLSECRLLVSAITKL